MTQRENGHPYREKAPEPAAVKSHGWRAVLADGLVLVVLGMLALVALSFAGGDSESTRTWTFTEPLATAAEVGFVTPMHDSGAWMLDRHDDATGGRAMVNRAGAAGAPPSLALAGEPNTRDVRAHTRCTQVGWNGTGGCGLVLRYRDPGNHYFAALDIAAGSVSLVRVRGGERVALASAPVALDASRWHDLAFEVRAESFLVMVDGVPVLEVRDVGLRDAGLVGLWAPSVASVAFDALHVEPHAASPFDFELMPMLLGGKR